MSVRPERPHRTQVDDEGPSPSPDRAILFVSHDAWRTGAPTVLLHFLRWMKTNTDIRFITLLREGVGDLRPEFERLGPVFAWNEMCSNEVPRTKPSMAARLVNRVLPQSSRPPATFSARGPFINYLREANVGLIYSNTITNGEILEALTDPTRAVITHVHELEYWILHRMDPANLEQNRRFTSHFVAVSDAVREFLVNQLGIDRDRIDLVYEFVPVDSLRRTEMPSRVRERLGVPKNAFVVGGAGTTDWRKAPDLFVQLAAVVRRDRPDQVVHFVWVGGEHQGARFAALWHDVTRAGVADRVHFVGIQPNPLDYFDAFDVFALTSREDPFPLVCLEAASAGKPIVCFDLSGGAREFVEHDAGMVVPYLDLNAMAGAIRRLSDDPQLRSRLGRRAAEKVRQRHDVNVVAPLLIDVIRRFLPPVRQ